MKTVIVKQKFNVSPSKLWPTITEHHLMIQWFFENIPAFKAEKDFTTQFNVATPERNFLHLWKIIEVVAENKIVYDWRYPDYEGESTVTFEITPLNKGSELKLTHKVIKPFTANIPEFTEDSCHSGWEYFINNRLKNFVADNI